MFKYRLLTGYKLPASRLLKKYGKWILLYTLLLVVLTITFLFLNVARLSSYGNLDVVKADDLNYALSELPAEKESRDTWRGPRVNGASIFSAYLDTRPEVVLEENWNLARDETAWAMIRIIGVVPVKLVGSNIMCYYRYRNKVTRQTYTFGKRALAVRLAAFGENFEMEFCAAFILCELPGREDSKANISLPGKVTITSVAQERPDDLPEDEFVVVRYPKKGFNNSTTINGQSESHSVAVCVQPLHHSFDKVLDLVSFIEFYRMMGVDRFTFYRDSYTDRVNQVLNYYARSNVATLLDWHLPNIYVFEKNLRVDGIFAALNDCLYRSTFHDSYRYVAGVDVDEYIVPRIHGNFYQLMKYLNPSDTDLKNGAWIFRNMFFYLMHDDDSTTLEPGLPKLKLHTKTLRWREVNHARDRSKFIVQGRDVIDLGNHQVWWMKRTWSIFGSRYNEVTVDPKVAASQHYRKCETNIEKCWQRETIVDRTAHRFTDRLARKVARVIKEIFPTVSVSSLVD